MILSGHNQRLRVNDVMHVKRHIIQAPPKKTLEREQRQPNNPNKVNQHASIDITKRIITSEPSQHTLDAIKPSVFPSLILQRINPLPPFSNLPPVPHFPKSKCQIHTNHA
jgi:hypothetical protein